MPWLPMQICHVPCQLVKLALEYTAAPTLSFMRSSLWHSDFINIWYMLMIAWQQVYRANQRMMVTVVMIIFTELTHVFPSRLLFLVGSQSCLPNWKRLKNSCLTHNLPSTDLHCVLEAVVKLHLNTSVFCNCVQDHPQEHFPHALENSTRQQTQWNTHTFVFTSSSNYTSVPLTSFTCSMFSQIRGE